MNKEDKQIVQIIINNIDLDITDYKEIKTGFSSDRKYILHAGSGVFLLRVSDIDQSQNRKIL